MLVLGELPWTVFPILALLGIGSYFDVKNNRLIPNEFMIVFMVISLIMLIFTNLQFFSVFFSLFIGAFLWITYMRNDPFIGLADVVILPLTLIILPHKIVMLIPALALILSIGYIHLTKKRYVPFLPFYFFSYAVSILAYLMFLNPTN